MSKPAWKSKGVAVLQLETIERLGVEAVKEKAPNAYIVGIEAEVINRLSSSAKNDLAMMLGSVLNTITSEEK